MSEIPKEILVIDQDKQSYLNLKKMLDDKKFEVLDNPIKYSNKAKTIEIEFFKANILNRCSKFITVNTSIILIDLFLRVNEEFANGSTYYLKNQLSSISIANSLTKTYPNIRICFMKQKDETHKYMNSVFYFYDGFSPDWIIIEKALMDDKSEDKNIFNVTVKALTSKI
jgi:hypothetical protein